MKKLGCVAVAWFGVLMVAVGSARAQEGVEGATVRPVQGKAKVDGCKIATPGDYEATVGDLIELDYTYPIYPATMPKELSDKEGAGGVVVKSPLGFRRVHTPMLVGAGTIACYFEAKKEGEETVTLTIDGAEYVYKIKVIGKSKHRQRRIL